MKEELQSSKINLGPVDTVCHYILERGLSVSEKVLNLNAIGLFNHSAFYNNRIKVLKEEGVVKSGGFTKASDTALKEKFCELARGELHLGLDPQAPSIDDPNITVEVER